MEEIGFFWHTDRDGTPYIADDLAEVTQDEAESYYDAAETLYDLFVKTGDYVVENDLFHEIGIPFNLVELIKMSWQNSVHRHLYGRFDLAGGLDGLPIKLLEFNADTPTALLETAVVQWAQLKANGLDEERQFNTLYEGMVENFRRLITLDDDPETFEEHYEGWKILFSSTRDNPEEEQTVKFLQMCANDAGFHTTFCHLDEVGFDEEEGIFGPDGTNYEFWFKLYPWEEIALEENLPRILTEIMRNQKAIFLNPAYTLMFQSKGFLKYMVDLFPDCPYLLQTDFQPLAGIKQVRKPFFGREGANTAIIEADGSVEEETGGEYENYPVVYQEFAQLPADEEGNRYQAGLFYGHEAVALAYRKGGLILDNLSKFVGHRLV